MTKRLVLLGGGHANLHVLELLARRPVAGVDITLISPYRTQIYSGMLPGWIAGHYPLDECQIALDALARAANANLLLTHAHAIDADGRRVILSTGQAVDYDYLVVDVGSGVQTRTLRGEPECVVPIRPAHHFVDRYRSLLASHQGGRIAVVGAGMAGIEVACAIRQALGPSGEVALFAGQRGMAPSHSRGIRARLSRTMQARGIEVIAADIHAVGDSYVETSAGKRCPASFVVLATGPKAPRLFQGSGLELDTEGYVKVDPRLQAISHPNVLAAGDCASLPFSQVTKSGVFAVRQGAVLAHNVHAMLTGSALRQFKPQRRVLYLMSTGARYAIASWGPLSWEGAWVWKWKDRIDRRFMSRFAEAAAR